MEGLVRLNYNPNFNALYRKRSHKVDEFLERFGREASRRMLEKTVSNIASEQGDAILSACFWEEGYLKDIGQFRRPAEGWAILVFPEFGDISKYSLTDSSPLSQVSTRGSDPIVVTDYQNPICISPESVARYISLTRRGSENLVFNQITGIVLFKHNFVLEPSRYSFLQKLVELYPEQFSIGS